MKYLILFELGKKRFVQAFSSHNQAVDAINELTKLADDVILSINALADEKYQIVFIDGSEAYFKIVQSKDELILGYYPADLTRIFAKLRNILISKQFRAEKDKKIAGYNKAMKRVEALMMIVSGIGIMFGGFTVASLAFAPNGQAWQFAAMGSLLALGLASTLRGGHVFIRPVKKPKAPRLVKQTV